MNDIVRIVVWFYFLVASNSYVHKQKTRLNNLKVYLTKLPSQYANKIARYNSIQNAKYLPKASYGSLLSNVFEKDSNHDPTEPDKMVQLEMIDEVEKSFMSYALSTILGRALPDVRDGLKPVHRRVLYAMFVLNLLPSSAFRKCARVVGEVLGKYHPHGDQSVYDALVRMAQDFVMLHPLVVGHGNFGSIDDDPPAAMRYTESKLSQLAFDSLLADIDDDCVDFIQNFDGSEVEPKNLPSKLPLLLINGASGIAVGMATNIPPHNLGEVVEGILRVIKDPSISDEELINIIPAPDFPTGGKIVGNAGSQKLYQTGNGGIIVRAKIHIESINCTTKTQSKSRNAIIVTEIPYMVNKASLLTKIAELVNDKKLDGISDIRDESDRDGIRMVIELKRDFNPDVVINNLYKKTQLQTTFSGNIMAIVNDGMQPKRLTLRNVLDEFLNFRFATIRRRTQYRLDKAEKRFHIVVGLLQAFQDIDNIISLIRETKTTAETKSSLSSKYGFSTEQCDAILSLKLGRLSSFEDKALTEEQGSLTSQISELCTLMTDESAVYSLISKEVRELRDKYGQPRKTEILRDESALLKDEDLIPNERCVVIISGRGYIKRVSYDEFDSQSRGGKGKSGMRLDSEADTVVHFFSCNSHDSLLFVTNRGVAFKIKAFNIPLSARTSRGLPLPQVLPIPQNDLITAVIPIENFSKNDFVVLLTSHGFIKRTPIEAFENMSSRGLVIISLRDSDSLRWVRRCGADDEVLVATRDGLAARFEVNDLPSTGRNSMGLQALSLRDGDEMADIDVITSSSLKSGGILHFLLITEKGYGKRVSIDEFRLKRRRGAGVTAIKFKDKAGGSPKISRDTIDGIKDSDALRCMRVCFPGDEIVMSTEKGAILRQKVDDLTIQSRAATGVLVQKLSKDDSIQMIDIIPAESADIE